MNNNVNNKLYAKLSSKKVELDMFGDFQRLNKKAIGSGADIGGELNKLSSSIEKVKADIKKSIKDQEEVIEIGNNLSKASKEIGLPLPKDVAKGISGAIQWSQELGKILSQLEKFNIG